MKRLKNGFLVSGLLLCTVFTGCSSDSDDGGKDTPYTPIALTPGQTRACEKNNDFALSYLRETVADNENGNIAVSPFTVYGLLGMMANGAAGETRSEIMEVMGYNDLDELNSYYSTLSSTLPTADSRTDLSIATSVWTKSGLSLNSDFSQRVSEYYGAELQVIPTNAGKALTDINKWASDKTKGTINNFLSDFDCSIMATFLTATYFKGKWSNVFDKDKTKTEDFHDANGVFMKKTPMMTNEQSVEWYEGDIWNAVDLRYGNGSFKMTLILPEEGKSVEECLASITPGALTETSSFYRHPKKMEIKLPKFKIQPQTQDIKSLLVGMGLTKAFDPLLSDYSGMSDNPGLFFDNIMQSTMIAVDEEGTVASSVAVSNGATSMISDGKFYADRPFIFLIRERSTGTILFAGTVKNPEYK